jgi:MFS family permease
MPRIVKMLILGRAVNRVGAFSLAFLVLLLTEDHGWSPQAAGLAMSGFGLATIPSRLVGGRWADHLGRRTTIVVGLVGCAVAQLGLAASTSAYAVLSFVVLLGLCFEIYEPASQALVADSVDPPDQLRAHAAMAAALAVAGALAGGLAALLASVDLRWLFVADAVSCLAAACVLGRALPRDVPTGKSEARTGMRPDMRPGTSAGARRSPWRDRRLLVVLGVQTVFAVVYLQATVALPLTVRARGLDTWLLGVVLCVSAVTMVATQPLLGTGPVRRWSTRTRLTAGFLVMAVGMVGYAFATTPWLLLSSTVVVALGDLVLIGQLLTLGSRLAPADLRARYLAVFGTSWGFASVAAPLIGTALIATVGPAGTWTSLAVVCLALAAGASRCIPGRVHASMDESRVAACEASPPKKRLHAPRRSPSTATTSRST